MKRCRKCRLVKSFSEFGPNRRARDRRSYYCQPCTLVMWREYREKYRRRDPDYDVKARQQSKNNYRLRMFGLTRSQYLMMFEEQNGVCAICKRAETLTVGNKVGNSIRDLAVDHNHKTGKVRGLLCGRCNAGLGQFRENVKYLKGAIAYVRLYEGINPPVVPVISIEHRRRKKPEPIRRVGFF